MSDYPLGWHFSTGTLRYGDGRRVEAGVTHTVDVEPVICMAGLHDSERITDALRYARGPVLARTRLGGKVVVGHDKRCATERTYIAVADVTNILHEFTCRCAERLLARIDNPDPRGVAAVAAKRAWLRGETDDDALDAARYAAMDAARVEERSGARGAMWAAPRDSVWAAARDAAWAAERDWQEAELLSMVGEVMEVQP